MIDQAGILNADNNVFSKILNSTSQESFQSHSLLERFERAIKKLGKEELERLNDQIIEIGQIQPDANELSQIAMVLYQYIPNSISQTSSFDILASPASEVEIQNDPSIQDAANFLCPSIEVHGPSRSASAYNSPLSEGRVSRASDRISSETPDSGQNIRLSQSVTSSVYENWLETTSKSLADSVLETSLEEEISLLQEELDSINQSVSVVNRVLEELNHEKEAEKNSSLQTSQRVSPPTSDPIDKSKDSPATESYDPDSFQSSYSQDSTREDEDSCEIEANFRSPSDIENDSKPKKSQIIDWMPDGNLWNGFLQTSEKLQSKMVNFPDQVVQFSDNLWRNDKSRCEVLGKDNVCFDDELILGDIEHETWMLVNTAIENAKLDIQYEIDEEELRKRYETFKTFLLSLMS